MSSSAECTVLIPSSTLEDFPVDLDDCDACSLLAGWTVAWHPVLIARAKQIPTWIRADAPPEPNLASPELNSLDKEPLVDSFSDRVFIVPGVSLSQVPAGYRDRVLARGAKWVTGANRTEYLQGLGLAGLPYPTLHHGDQSISSEDFFAAGYVSLQIQILTRRLRYTSNLDLIHLESCLVEAAQAFLDGQAETAIDSLHQVFDAFAEERDHYFSSDPHLIDLMLVTESTVDRAVEAGASVDETSVNFLLDSSALEALSQRDDASAIAFCKAIAEGSHGLACGGPPADWIAEISSDAELERVLRDQYELTTSCIGTPPQVFARLTGGVTAPMVPAIKRLGYQGLISNDFVAGTGFENESKVMFSSDEHVGEKGEIEALTAQPIDAASDAAFLAFALKLGEAIDSGEIATGLLVHWPGAQCDSFLDLKRSLRWGVALGKFWKIDEYFDAGERPYHQGQLPNSHGQSALLLDQLVKSGAPNPISTLAERFQSSVQQEANQTLMAMSALISGSNVAALSTNDSFSDKDTKRAAEEIAKAVGVTPRGGAEGRLMINPHLVAIRSNVELDGVPQGGDHVFAVLADNDTFTATVDVPGGGFSIVVPDPSRRTLSGPSLGKRLRNRFLGRPETICDGHSLHNEFMQVTIDQVTGGIASVYSGQTRGNRFSMRLVSVGNFLDAKPGDPPTGSTDSTGSMQCDKIETLKQSAAEGTIRCTGRLLAGRLLASDSQGDASPREFATFQITYTLKRGSRLIETQLEFKPVRTEGVPSSSSKTSKSPWNRYFAIRSAVSEDSSIIRSIQRDRLVRTGKRRMLAPLGLVIDEAERKTTIASHGMPFHQAIGDRYVDTLVDVQGETCSTWSIDFGFDVVEPVTTAHAAISASPIVSVEVPQDIAMTGWFVHLSPRTVLARDVRTHFLASGEMVLSMRLVQTRGKAETAKIQCFLPIEAGYRVDRDLDSLLAKLEEDSRRGPVSDSSKDLEITINHGVAKVPLPGHGSSPIALVLTPKTHGTPKEA